jgi:ankyrin repeat protein
MTKLLQTRSEKKVTEISAEEIGMIKSDVAEIVNELRSVSAQEAKTRLINVRFGSTKNSILHIAAKFDCPDAVKDIIEISRGDLMVIDSRNSNSFTPLHFAAISGDVEIARLLINAGVDRNPQASADKRRWTPIHYAARYGSLEVLELLMRFGVDKEFKTGFGLTPFIIAAEFGHLPIIEFLLKNGADKNLKTTDENNMMNALHYAVVDGHFEVADYLLKAGIERDRETLTGFSALDFAARTDNVQMAILLMSWGIGSLTHALVIAKESRSEKVARVIEKYISVRERIFDKKWIADLEPKLVSALKEFHNDNLSEAKFSPAEGTYFNAYGILLLKKTVGFFKKEVQTLKGFCLDAGFVQIADEIRRVSDLVTAAEKNKYN